MKINWLALGGLLMAVASPLQAQSDANMAMNDPDQFAWRLFIQVNASAGGSNALFETWASDADTFKMQPAFPTTATPLSLRQPVVPQEGRQALLAAGHVAPQIPPVVGRGVLEETRRNKATFDFIVKNNLHKISGLKAAYDKPPISFPVDSIEVKANWLAVDDVPAFMNNRVTAAQVPQMFHVNTGNDGKKYALLAMHVISKAVPNWTWATFEHELNPARCDILGCHDRFGLPASVAPNAEPDKGYPPCAKTAALSALFATAQWDSAFTHYCLKGSQSDMIDTTGLYTRVGNSITEAGFVDRASCMTCHGRAAFNAQGKATSNAGFNVDGSAPVGPLLPNWFWSAAGNPPVLQPGLEKIAQSADFVWSVPFCAVDDTATPPRLRCTSK